MPVDNAESVYTVDRKAASKLLKVSMRTLDRYVKAKKLSSALVDGRIWLNRGELVDFVDAGERRHVGLRNYVSMPDLSIDNAVQIDVDSVDTGDEGRSEIFSKPRKSGGKIYKKLYLELKEELKEKQDRLEIANYRVGQLESQIRNSVPMLEYHREKFDREKLQKDLNEKLQITQEKLAKTLPVLRYERLTKRIFMVVLLTLLALQPLWLLLANSSQ